MARSKLTAGDCIISFVSGYGFLGIAIMFWGVIACSSSSPKAVNLNASKDSISVLAKPTNSTHPTEPDKNSISGHSQYTPLDRAIIYNYAEKGGRDAGIVNKALEMVQESEQRSEEQSVVEDYLLLAIHYWRKSDNKRVIQYAHKGLGFETDNKRMKSYFLIYLGLAYEDKDKSMAQSNFQLAIQADPDFYRGYYESGRIHFRQRHFPEAEAKFKQAMVLKPDESSTHEMLGHVYHRTEKYEEAVASYFKALQLDPEASGILPELGDVLFYGLRKREEAGRIYKEAVFQNGNNSEAHLALGGYYQYRREYQKAEEEFKEAIRLNPARQTIYKLKLNQLYSEIEKMPKAEKEIKESLAKNPDSPEIRVELGKFYLKWSKFEDAESQFKMAVKKAPKNPKYISELGKYYFHEGNYEKAEQYSKSALKNDAQYVQAWILLGRVYQKQKKYDQAISQYAQAVKLDPENLEAVERLNSLQVSINPPTQEDREKKFIEKVRQNPNQVEPLIFLGGFYYQIRNYEKAVETYQKVFLVEPDSIFTRFLLGETYLVQKKMDQAEKEYSMALQLSSKAKNPPKVKYEHWKITLEMILDKLTMIYVEQKNFKKAEKLYHNAYKSNPDSILKHFYLANLYKLQKKMDEWKSELETIIRLDPKDTRARIELAHYYAGHKNYEKAESLYQEILKIKPSYTFIKAKLKSIEPFLEKPEQSAKHYAGIPEKIKEELKASVGEGWDPLLIASANGNLEEVQKLLDKGADIESVTERGRTPLYVAAMRGRLDVVKLLLKKGADVNANDGIGGYSPLHVAAAYKYPEVVEYLIAHGAQVDARTNWGDTVLMNLMYEVWHQDSSIAEILVRHGADIRATNKFGCRAICYASQEGNPYAIEFLLKQGINPNWKNAHGATPLYLAISSNHSKAVKALLEGGADPRVDVNGITPMDLARSLKYTHIVNILQNWDPQNTTKKVAKP